MQARQEVGMTYIVQAILTKSGIGRSRAELVTRRDAIESANELRLQGMEVNIIGPDGKLLDETDGEHQPQSAPVQNPGGMTDRAWQPSMI
jgi:hypothetical protein